MVEAKRRFASDSLFAISKEGVERGAPCLELMTGTTTDGAWQAIKVMDELLTDKLGFEPHITAVTLHDARIEEHEHIGASKPHVLDNYAL